MGVAEDEQHILARATHTHTPQRARRKNKNGSVFYCPFRSLMTRPLPFPRLSYHQLDAYTTQTFIRPRGSLCGGDPSCRTCGTSCPQPSASAPPGTSDQHDHPRCTGSSVDCWCTRSRCDPSASSCSTSPSRTLAALPGTRVHGGPPCGRRSKAPPQPRSCSGTLWQRGRAGHSGSTVQSPPRTCTRGSGDQHHRSDSKPSLYFEVNRGRRRERE